MLLIQLENLSVLDYEIAGSNTGNVFSFAVCGVLDLSRFIGVSCFSHHVKWSSLFISLELCFVLQMCTIWIFGLVSYIRVGGGDYVWSEDLGLAPGVLSRVSIPQAVT